MEFSSPTSICNAFPHILLQLNRVVTLSTHFICNALAICPLAAGIAAINRVGPFGRKCLATPFANLDTGRLRQAPLLQLLTVANISALLIMAILFGPNSSIKLSAAALADDLMDGIIISIRFASHFALIAPLQNILMLVFPITIPHGDFNLLLS